MIGMSKVYLAGPITGLSWNGATSWRVYASTQFVRHSIEAVDPLRGKHYLSGEKSIALNYDEHAMSTSKAITSRDRFDVERCDLVLANFLGSDPHRTSVGTVVELGWADAFRTPVILCAPPDHPLRLHPITSQIAAWEVDDLDHAIAIAAYTIGK
jgi:nucleoside 2-deoxyribosyltransferase